MAIELTDHIRDRVQKALMLALPKKELDELIQAEIDKFFQESTDAYHHTIPAPFSKMLQIEIETRAKALLVKWLDGHFETIWTGNEEKFVGEAVKQFVPVVLQELGANITSAALARIRQELTGSSY